MTSSIKAKLNDKANDKINWRVLSFKKANQTTYLKITDALHRIS